MEKTMLQVGLNVKILSQQKKIFQENKNHIKNFI